MDDKKAREVLDAFIKESGIGSGYDDPQIEDVFEAMYESGGAILESSGDLQPDELTHFPLWPSGEEYEPREGDPTFDDCEDPDDPPMEVVEAADRVFGYPLMVAMAKEHDLPEVEEIAIRYRDGRIDQLRAFELITEAFAKEGGFLVYDGTGYWEAYAPPEDVSEAISTLAPRFVPTPKPAFVVDDGEGEVDEEAEAVSEELYGDGNDVLDCIRSAHPSGGGEVDVEPEGDAQFFIDYERMEDYRPTTMSLANDLAYNNRELNLGLDNLVEGALAYGRQAEVENAAKLAKGEYVSLEAPWEDAVKKALIEKGYIVYASDTRFEGYKFSPGVHAFFAKRAKVGVA